MRLILIVLSILVLLVCAYYFSPGIENSVDQLLGPSNFDVTLGREGFNRAGYIENIGEAGLAAVFYHRDPKEFPDTPLRHWVGIVSARGKLKCSVDVSDYNKSGDEQNEYYCLHTDYKGGFYAFGWHSDYGYVVDSYSAGCRLKWKSPNIDSSGIVSADVSSRGDIVVLGNDYGPPRVCYLNSKGKLLWKTDIEKWSSGSRPTLTEPADVCFGKSGDIYVLGTKEDQERNPKDIAIVRLSDNGSILSWAVLEKNSFTDTFAYGIEALGNEIVIVALTKEGDAHRNEADCVLVARLLESDPCLTRGNGEVWRVLQGGRSRIHPVDGLALLWNGASLVSPVDSHTLAICLPINPIEYGDGWYKQTDLEILLYDMKTGWFSRVEDYQWDGEPRVSAITGSNGGLVICGATGTETGEKSNEAKIVRVDAK